MSEFYAEPEISVEQELSLLRSRLAISTAQNDALRKEVEVLKDKNLTLAARVRQLEFEATVGGGGMRFAQRSDVPERMGRILPHDASSGLPKGGLGKPGL